MTVPSRSDRDHFGRLQAATLLRAARAGQSEAIEWAFAALPESRYALRLRIAQLVDDDDHATADALIARGLRHHPDDLALRRLNATSLARRGLQRRADRAIRRVLADRPHHVGSLVIAARIARVECDWPRATELLQRSLAVDPDRDDIRATLCNVLLEGGCIERATDVLGTMHTPSPVLCGRVLAKQDRTADAIEWLDDVWRKPCFAGERDEILTDLLDLLERGGQYRRIERLLGEITAPGPVLALRAARSWLQLGGFRHAIRLAAPFRALPTHRDDALGTIVVAAAMLGRDRLAARMFTRLQSTPRGADAVRMAELWRRALFARTFRGRGVAGIVTEQKPGHLRPLLDSAATVLREAARGQIPTPSGLTRTELARSRAVCLASAGRGREASLALAEADSVVPVRSDPPPISLVRDDDQDPLRFRPAA